MQSISHSNFVRYAPRKVNRVLELVRKKSVIEALRILRVAPQKPALLIAKTIKSAAANAGDQQAANPNLYVESAWVGQGPVLKRMRAYAMGRGSTYKRKTCHLTVVIAENQKKSKISQGV